MNGMPFLASSSGPAWLPAAAAEARRFAYWTQIVCLIFFIVWLIVGLAVLAVAPPGFFDIWGVVYVIFAVIDILIMYMLKASVFDPIDQGKFREASDHLLIWGVVGLVLGAVIPGLFLLLAWIKIQEVFQVPYQAYQAQSYQGPPQYQAPPQYQPQHQPQYQQPPQQYQAPPQYQPVAPAPVPAQPQAPPVQPAQQRTVDQHKADMVKCKNCGVQYPSFMRNCPNCGTPR